MEVHNTVHEAANKAIPKKMKSKKAKGLSPESFKYLKKEEKHKPREKGKSASNLRQHSKEEHPENAEPPILVTLSGTIIEGNPLQLQNAYCPISVNLSGMVILVNLAHPSNA